MAMPTKPEIHVRLPIGLHAALVEEAERQGTSLNALAVTLLAAGIGWQPTQQAGPRRRKRPGPDTRRYP